MKLRCELHLDHELYRLILVPKPEEKTEHLALKLAAYAMFHSQKPVVEPSSSHPSLSQLDVKPDVLGTDEGGDISLWVECGPTSINKLDKVARRLPAARVVVLSSSLREAGQLRGRLQDETKHAERIQIWTWPDGLFSEWLAALEEKTEVFGEAGEKYLNIVVNNIPFVADFIEV